MAYVQITISAVAELEETLTMLLFQQGAEGVAIDDPAVIAAHLALGDWDASVFDGQDICTGRVTLTALLTDDGHSRARCAQLEQLCRQWPGTECQFCDVPDTDWQQQWKESFQPIPVGKRLLVLPMWLQEQQGQQEQQGRLAIVVNPGQAFGTGDHATTAMVLEFLEELVTPGMTVLDVGCGSGILAIAALKLGAKAAYGVDIDPVCRDAVAEHLRLNQIPESALQLHIGDILHREDLRRELSAVQASLVTANLTAGLLMAAAPWIGDLVGAGGRFICSGIIAEREDQVSMAFAAAGLRILERRRQAGWLALLCAVKGDADGQELCDS
ncbi:MAG: 50S ribosomal protein L11 methyltransferase [Clostridiales bacterium]